MVRSHWTTIYWFLNNFNLFLSILKQLPELTHNLHTLTIKRLSRSFSILSLSFFSSRSAFSWYIRTALASFRVLCWVCRWWSRKSLACCKTAEQDDRVKFHNFIKICSQETENSYRLRILDASSFSSFLVRAFVVFLVSRLLELLVAIESLLWNEPNITKTVRKSYILRAKWPRDQIFGFLSSSYNLDVDCRYLLFTISTMINHIIATLPFIQFRIESCFQSCVALHTT